jgi:hypothetical protein
MNLTEFYDVYKLYGNRDKITIQCNKDGCSKTETLNKDSAIRNIKQNGCFLCRSCCYTEEGLKRISEATSYKRSEETKRKMSESAKLKWLSPEGEALKQRLSIKTSQQQKGGPALKSRRYHYHQSPKAGLIYTDSSYELKAAIILDNDDDVITYKNQIPFVAKSGNGRRLDFMVELKSGVKRVLEVKPKRRLPQFTEQIEDNREYAIENHCEFAIWTECNLGFNNEHEATKWADEYLAKQHNVDYVQIRKNKNVEKVMRHYHKHIAQDKVTVHCAFCGIDHEALRLTYEKNIARNGRYICEREGGFIAGSKPKKRKVNPYAAEGKKECTKCGEIKVFGEFNSDKSRSDGYGNKCRLCNQKECTERYERKNDIDTI